MITMGSNTALSGLHTTRNSMSIPPGGARVSCSIPKGRHVGASTVGCGMPKGRHGGNISIHILKSIIIQIVLNAQQILEMKIQGIYVRFVVIVGLFFLPPIPLVMIRVVRNIVRTPRGPEMIGALI